MVSNAGQPQAMGYTSARFPSAGIVSHGHRIEVRANQGQRQAQQTCTV